MAQRRERGILPVRLRQGPVARTVVVKVPVPIKTEPCVLYRAPVPGPDVTAGSAAEVAYLARLLSWAVSRAQPWVCPPACAMRSSSSN